MIAISVWTVDNKHVLTAANGKGRVTAGQVGWLSRYRVPGR